MASLYDIPVTALDGAEGTLAPYKGQVLLIVNVASQCGLTPHYAGLEQLHRELGPRGLTVLGFPCNQFGGQEPGTAEEIRAFCSTTYDVTFPLFAKVDVNGPATHPLYRHLKKAKWGFLWTRDIKWNFTKFLIGRDGRVIQRFAPTIKPEAIRPAVEAALN